MSRQPNPITRQTWGIEPRSLKRRVKLLFLIGGEVLVYLIVWVSMAWVIMKSGGWPQRSLSLRFLWEALATATGCAGGVLALRMISRIVLWDRHRQRIQTHWQEWHLTFITGRQMLFGVANPAIVTSIILAVLHLGAYALTAVYFSRDRGLASFLRSVREGGANADLWGGAVALLFVIFAMLVIVPLNMALIAWGWGRATRALSILAFVLIGPMLVATVVEQFGVGINWPLVGVIEMASWIPRVVCAWWLPFRAARVLDQPPGWIE